MTADAPAAQLPEWLGKRPPVEGDWVKTFDENFDGPDDRSVEVEHLWTQLLG